MENWHLEGPGGDILCGADHGFIQPATLGGMGRKIDPHVGPARTLCPACLRAVGREWEDIQKRAQERQLAALERGEYPPGVEEQCLESEWEEWCHREESLA